MPGLAILILLFVCLPVNLVFSAEPSKKEGAVKERVETGATTHPALEKAIKVSPPGQPREPFDVSPEFEVKKEELEPPEIKVTGIMEVKGKKAALVELQLEKCEGTVVLEPGMRVSIPKPDKSESERWMTYFTVKRITKRGMVIVMENGEMVWYPVMGALD
jgi:hypothetical protein